MSEYVMTRPITLVDLLRKVGMSQRDLAEKIGVAQATVGRWCRGETSPSIHDAQAIAGVCRMPIQEVVTYLLVPAGSEPVPAPSAAPALTTR